MAEKIDCEVVTRQTDSGSIVNIYLDRELLHTITPEKQVTELPKEVRPKISKALVSMIIIILILVTFIGVMS